MNLIKYILVISIVATSSLGVLSQQDTLGPISIGNLYIDYMRPQEYELGPIRVEGADNFDHNAIRLLTGLRQGETITVPGDKITKAVKNLWDEGLFSNVEISADKEVAGVLYLKILLTPRPKLSRFRFTGVNRREADKIREEITLFSGKTISENLVFATENRIKGYFREKGFYSVGVNINRITDTLINNSEIFVINIKKGERVKIGNITILGNTSIPTWKLKWAMKDTKQKALWRIFKRSKFSESAYKRDRDLMIGKFNEIGMRDAEVANDTVYLADPKNLNIEMNVDEGNLYYFGNIEWVGNTKFRSSFLDTVLGIKKGDIYNKTLLDQRLLMSMDGRDISSLYMDRGYLFFQVIPVEMSIVDNHINYQMRIIEGKQARVKKVIIKGNTKTSEHVIRREVRTSRRSLQ